MDLPAPVAGGINTQGPMQSLNMAGSFMDLQKSRLALQQGQQTLAQQKIETQKQQQSQGFLKDWDPSEHIGDDGTIDLGQAMGSDAFKKLDVAKPVVMDMLQRIKGLQLQQKQQLANLDGTTINQFGSGLGAFAKDPDVINDTDAGRGKVADFLQNFGAQSPQNARIAKLYGGVVQHAPKGKLADGVRAVQLQAADVLGQRGQQNPQLTQVQTDKGVQNVNVSGSPDTGAQPGAKVGPPVANAPAPAIATLPSGQLGPVGGVYGPNGVGGPQAAAPQAKLQPLTRPAPNAPRADQENYNAQIQAASQHVQGVSNAANDPKMGVQAMRFNNQQILDLIPHASTGPGLKLLNTIASRIPGETGDAYQVIEHFTAQNSAALARTMNVPSTNLGQETGAAAAGNVERNPGALSSIVKTNDALNTAFDLYNRGLAKVTNNGSDVSRVNAYKQAFGSNIDVNALQWADAHRRGDKQEQSVIEHRLGPQGMAAARQKLKVLKSLAETGDLP